MTFDELGLHPTLLKGIQDMGFTRPTPVQAEAIPHILAGRDVMASAQTGTGKTAAFMLPIMHRILSEGRKSGIRALVVAPTRELAQQSLDHVESLGKYTHIKCTAIYGGVAFPPQIKALESGVEIVSATPGRLLDHVQSGRIRFDHLDIFVLDEADRMTDMGFLPDVRRILALMPKDRQNLIFSATLPSETLGLCESICKDPVRVQLGPRSVTVPAGIRHAAYPVNFEQKLELLLKLLRNTGTVSSVLIFTRTKQRADRLGEILEKAGFKTTIMHGDRSQAERQHALEDFRRGTYQVMIATDIAARGLDIDDITHVINYDVPDEPENYIHRIGRTGRAEAEGDAFTLMAPEEEPWITAVERLIGKPLPRVTLPDFDYRASTIAGSYHPRPGYIKSLRPGERPRGGGRGGPRRR